MAWAWRVLHHARSRPLGLLLYPNPHTNQKNLTMPSKDIARLHPVFCEKYEKSKTKWHNSTVLGSRAGPVEDRSIIYPSGKTLRVSKVLSNGDLVVRSSACHEHVVYWETPECSKTRVFQTPGGSYSCEICRANWINWIRAGVVKMSFNIAALAVCCYLGGQFIVRFW